MESLLLLAFSDEEFLAALAMASSEAFFNKLLFNFQDLGGMRLISLTGEGPVADLLLIAAAALTVLGGARMTVTQWPGALLFLGVFLLVAVLAGPAIFVHFKPGAKVTIPFLPLAVLEFTGAAFLGTGLRRLFWGARTTPRSIQKEPDAD